MKAQNVVKAAGTGALFFAASAVAEQAFQVSTILDLHIPLSWSYFVVRSTRWVFEITGLKLIRIFHAQSPGSGNRG